ncbi:hypothetical protein BGZ60DRAFT_90982 [Tricladium varicosporioides]|nr:hypothetical protein BGZ60DRAFT_90982 [Hymenoscyphus varicosporioides]
MPRLSAATPTGDWLYDLILHIFSLTVDIFFREIQVRGAWRVPSEGPIILVAAPHSNQFVDSIVLMKILRSLNHRISWLMAAKSFNRSFIGAMARAIGAVPVSRAMDVARPAAGTIYLPSPKNDPRLLKGTGTNFEDPSFKVGGSIYLPTIKGESHKLDIAEILGPARILLRTPPTHYDVLSQLVPRPDPEDSNILIGSKFKVAPHVDQTQVYEAVFETLRSNGCIGIFPEGGSHDRTQLLPLKAGIAIMALGALSEGTPISIVPVGLTYFSAHKFRSRAVIELGDTIHVPAPLVNDFKNGKKRDAIGTVMESISDALASVTVSAPDFETLQLVHTARRLYLTKLFHNDSKPKVSLANMTELNRRLMKGFLTYSSNPEMGLLARNLRSYSTSLHALGIKDHQLLSTTSRHNHFPLFFLLPMFIYRFFKLIVLATLTLPGLFLFAPVFILTRHISRRKTAEALAESSVKIRGHDVMATWKILVAAGLAPIFYTAYSILLVLLYKSNYTNVVLPANISTTTLLLLAWLVLPSITYASLVFGEQGMDILKSLYPLLLLLSPTSSHIVERLRDERLGLVLEVRELVDRFGPELFPDCEDIEMWKGRGPKKMFASISPEAYLEELVDLDDFV